MPAPDDPRAAVAQLLVRLRGCPPDERPAVVQRLLPLLANQQVPLALRYAAAARALESLPDQPGPVRSVVKALTARLPTSRALARMRHLQNLVERCESLDGLVARRERKVKLTCPRCAARLPRPDMAKHLWHEHGLGLQDGKVRSRTQLAQAVRAGYDAAPDPALIDRAALLGGEEAVRAWAAGTCTPDEAQPLCAAARDRGVGLCPGCFADVPPKVHELPPPLAVANGRVAGDGFVATVPLLWTPRARATLAATAALVALALAVPVPIALLASGIVYALALALFRPRSGPDDRAIDAAWRKHAPKLADRRDASRFLTRLCVTSFGRGDPFERANALNAIVARAKGNPKEVQLLAVAQALRIDDAARYGRDRAAGFAGLIGPALGGDRAADFAEHALAAYFLLPRPAGEVARLRVLLLAEAFANELTPRQVLALCDAGPNLARALRLSPNHVAVLYGVWANRAARPWRYAGPAETAFDLVSSSPKTATKLLAADPGLVLRADATDLASEFGPVVISVGGVSVGGATVADPEADVRLSARGRELVFGAETLRASGPLPDAVPDLLRGWLRFRAEVLAGYPTLFLSDEGPIRSQFLKPFAVRCRACRAKCLPAVGAVGRSL